MNEQAPLEPAIREEACALARDLCAFLEEGCCNFFAARELAKRLEAAGFQRLEEGARWSLVPGQRGYIERHGSAVLAFIAGTEPPAQAGFRMVGAHTDSPGFKVKPQPERVSKGVVHLGVEVYGGPIRATWTDRDLGLCGRVLVEGEGGVQAHLYRSGPLVCLPNVAIHQNREVNDKGLALNPQTQLTPILGTVAAGLPEVDALRAVLAAALGVEVGAILDFDLFLHDPQPPSFAGASGELLRSGRFDDLGMCHAGLLALIASAGRPTAATRIAAFVDAEEVGSETPQGARSTLLPHTLERLVLALGGDRADYLAALSRSVMVSADNAHAHHPGYGDKMDPEHAPVLNGGPVIKAHASRKYATDAPSAALFIQACRQAGVPFQRFVNRSDVASGGTIGSMTAAQLGIRVVDVGSAQWGMHSVRETFGAWDPWYMTRALEAFLAG
ncbi:MAG: M18 family aminopeptidase [Pseudomonadota bacterium]